MKLYIVRHGETSWNDLNLVQGVSDIPLSEKGVADALELQPLVSKLNIDVVYSSPLKRAKETAKILVDDKLPINIDDRILERRWGRNEGANINTVDRVNCWNVFLNTDEEGIEPIKHFMTRVSDFLEDIAVRYQNSNVLVVAHSAVVRVIHYLLGNIPEDGDLTKLDIPNLRILEYKL